MGRGGGWALYTITCTWLALAMEQKEWVGVGAVYNYTYMASNGADRMGGGGHCIQLHVHG